MPIDWSWLEDEDARILKTYRDIYVIECYTVNGKKTCHLYTKEGFNRLIKKPQLVEDIDYIEINGQSNYTIRNYISAESFITIDKILLALTDFFTFSGEGDLECKLVEKENKKLLYCLNEKFDGY